MTEAQQLASHTERIICPGCTQTVTATVEHTWPFASYVHFCECGYIIMESEWNRAEHHPLCECDECVGEATP